MFNEARKDTFKLLLVLFFLTVINFFVPFFSIFIYIIWPIPVVYMITKHGMKNAIILIVLAALLNGFALGALMGLYTIIGFGLIGFILGNSLEEGFSPLKTLLITIGAVLLSNVSITLASKYIVGFSYEQLFNDMIQIMGGSPEFSDFSLLIRQQLELIKRIFPALLTMSSIISGSLTYYATLWYLRRKGIEKPVYKPVSQWRFPAWWISLGIAAGLVFKTNIYVLNITIILMFLASIQGFAVGLHYISRSEYSSVFTAVFIFSIILFNFLSFLLLAFVGLVDMWFDLRRQQ